MKRISSGDFKNIDKYIEELKAEGYRAGYVNIYSDCVGFLARITVNGKEHAIWEGGYGGQMVRKVITPLSEIGKPS